MKKGRRLIALALAAALVAMPLSACSDNDSDHAGSSGNTIKVGILFSESGSTALVEKTMTNACKMAFDEINKSGGINGKKIEYIHEDYASDPSKATEKMKTLIEEDKVVATVGCYTSASRQATLPTLKEDNSLLIYPTYTEGEEVHPNVIYVGCMPNQQATEFVPYLLKKLGKKVYLVGSDYVFPKTCNKQARALVNMYGGSVVGESYVPLGGTDFSTVCEKIKKSGADFVYSAVIGDSNTAFFKAFKQYGLDAAKTPICSIGIDESNLQAIGADYAEGHYASMPYFSSLNTAASKKFVQSYNSLYKDGTKVTVLTESAYSSCYLLAAALKKTSDPSDTNALIKSFSGITFDAPQGQIKVDKANHSTWVFSRFAKIHNGNFDILYSSKSAARPEPWPSILYPQYKSSNFMPSWSDPKCYPQ
ncbi:MAG: transporter substrate-binding domain-containing protein [Oscillospiraceae bacterium]|nr:transporter substrate-binding domain-containing protein [Oscillospiraceae bacterium]